MDIARKLVRKVSQEVILADFNWVERILFIGTAVAEEGSTFRRMGVSFAGICRPTSPGGRKARARQRRSTCMFEEGSAMEEVEKWRGLAERMRPMYMVDQVDEVIEEEEEDEDMAL